MRIPWCPAVPVAVLLVAIASLIWSVAWYAYAPVNEEYHVYRDGLELETVPAAVSNALDDVSSKGMVLVGLTVSHSAGFDNYRVSVKAANPGKFRKEGR